MDATYTPGELKGAQKKGWRYFRKTSGQHGAKITVCCAVSTRGGYFSLPTFKGDMENTFSKNFCEFHVVTLSSMREKMRHDFVFLNAPGHRGVEAMNCNGIFEIYLWWKMQFRAGKVH